MSLALYMDVHVRFEITSALRQRGVDVLTAQADAADELDDPRLLDRATKLGRVTFTQDRDFLIEGARRQRTGTSFGGIIYAHQLALTIGQCVEWLELVAKVCDAAEFADRIEYLPLNR